MVLADKRNAARKAARQAAGKAAEKAAEQETQDKKTAALIFDRFKALQLERIKADWTAHQAGKAGIEKEAAQKESGPFKRFGQDWLSQNLERITADWAAYKAESTAIEKAPAYKESTTKDA